ncbi:hypothetical protein BU23DRAFT_504283 [Bimuria novae-zelandiae CBS 107.79]|uniref:DUF202 domain-containing protein n=1 Tax=Bimuria novae-zelandiae CBS 107.79 TaxID=1447943 RepID=A0A6A5VD77_9PLEO|nr:hypothetical protein BU23DRAFT_504283 [Bimuria novae-zelandiae CBS 107.79]
MDFRPLDRMNDTDEALLNEPFRPFYNFWAPKPVLVHQANDYDRTAFIERPWLGVLLFDNNASDARDHAANERTFLSWLRLSVYMAIVSVAIIMNFHLKSQPSAVEKKFSLPFGLIFWTLSVACLASGLANYIKTVTRYSRRTALVQAGWKTQTVFTVVATTIVAACILFLSTNAHTRR